MTTTGTELQKKPDTDIATQGEKQLMEGYAGFVNDDLSTAQERITRLAGLVPVALQVVSESRDTVERLRDENENLKRPDLLTGSDYRAKIGEIQHNVLVDLGRQYRAVRERIDLDEFASEVYDTLGPQISSAFTAYIAQQQNDAEKVA